MSRAILLSPPSSIEEDVSPGSRPPLPQPVRKASMSNQSLAETRIATVRQHMRLEAVHDFDAVINTFAYPRYELYGSGAVFDGEAAVRDYFRLSRIPFPDQGNEIIAIAHSGACVLV